MVVSVNRRSFKIGSADSRSSGIENTNYRYKTIIGLSIRSQNLENQKMEVQIGIRILNKMKALGMPKAKPAA